MEPVKAKIKGAFMQTRASSLSGRGNAIIEEWEVRPGGMLVQRRNSESNQNTVPVSMIKLTVKYGSSRHEIRISSQSSFGELKKVLAERTGVHPQDQKLIYKKRERDSKSFLDIERVKDGSKIVLIEDITSKERRCLEMLKSAKIAKASKFLQEISLEVDKLGEKVIALEAAAARGAKIVELDVPNLTEILMNKLVALDDMFVVEGNLKVQKQMQERRVQKHIQTLDKLKLNKSMASRNGGKIPLQQKQNSIVQNPEIWKKQPVVQSRQEDVTVEMPKQQRPLRHNESVLFTTQWETFD